MATITRFEEIEGWKKARELTKEVYIATMNAPFSKDFPLRDQIRKSCISVMSNIAEGFERGGNKEFSQFLSNAKGSAGEVKAQLYVALDVKWIDSKTFDRLYALAEDAANLIGGFMRYLEESELKGPKYRNR